MIPKLTVIRNDKRKWELLLFRLKKRRLQYACLAAGLLPGIGEKNALPQLPDAVWI